MTIEIEHEQHELILEVEATQEDLRGGGYPIDFEVSIQSVEVLAALNEYGEAESRGKALELLGEFMKLNDSAARIEKKLEEAA